MEPEAQERPTEPTAVPQEQRSSVERRFRAAMLCYGGIAVLAGATLHGDTRLVVLGALALFALKSWLYRLRTKLESSDSDTPQD